MKYRVKNAMLLMLAILIFVVNSIVVYAETSNDSSASTQSNTTVTSEALEYIANRSLTDKQLKSKGLSDEEITELRSFSYENALLERASYGDSQLHAIGYTDDQIEILRAYDGSTLTEDSPVLAATAVCTGTFQFNGYDSSTRKLSIIYKYTWNVQPVFNRDDSIAVSWRTVDPSAYIISSSATYKVASIYYYSTTTGNYYKSINYTPNPMSGFDGYIAKYPLLINVPLQADETIAAWGKSGYFRITLLPDGNNTINMAKVYGAVAHSQLEIISALGYTVGSVAPWSFTFTPAIEYKTVAAANYTITNSGDCYSN